MRSNLRSRSARTILWLALVMLAGGLMACSVSIAISSGDGDETYRAMATANARLATRVAAQEAMISYLATHMPRVTPPAEIPVHTPTPYLPVQGAVIIEEGRCCVGGVVGDTIQVDVAFQASSSDAPVREMRVRVGARAFNEREMADAAWEPFVRHRRYPIDVALNWVGWYVSVQYRDARGNVSPVCFDDISVEGMPLTPTIHP